MKLLKIDIEDPITYPKPVSSTLEFDVELLHGYKPDEHWALIDEKGFSTARCSLWWNSVPQLPNQRLGIIGHYAADNKTAAVEILSQACLRLRHEECTMAVGPMDGSIWRSYRLMTHNDGELPFFMEPDTPIEWSTHFRDSGFTETAHYFSAINSDLAREDPDIRRASQYMSKRGIALRNLTADDLRQELNRIYDISAVCFQHSPFYTQLDQHEFNKIYLGISPYIDPRLIFLAEHHGKPVGFIFALPDLLQAQRGVKMDTVIIKTVAVLPGRSYAGTGTVLIDAVQKAAHELGYRKTIHALMREGSISGIISSRTARPFRRYALFAKLL